MLTDNQPPGTIPYAYATFELKAAPTAGSVVRVGDLANLSARTAYVGKDWTTGWGFYCENYAGSRRGDIALYFESVSAADVHGHLSARLDGYDNVAGTFVYLCVAF